MNVKNKISIEFGNLFFPSKKQKNSRSITQVHGIHYSLDSMSPWHGEVVWKWWNGCVFVVSPAHVLVGRGREVHSITGFLDCTTRNNRWPEFKQQR